MNPSINNQHVVLLQRIMDKGEEVEVGEWQSQDVRDKPEMVSRELRHQTVRVDIPSTPEHLRREVVPNMPWAEDHFQERVSGIPHNPPPSEAWWPFARAQNAEHKQVGGTQFSHTYPERFWPKFANFPGVRPNGRQIFVPHNGIRYELGDLADVVSQLARNPLTRQAYLPIWFPEDTGAVSGQRVPCTLGYHFICRNGMMDIVYYMRSCDLLRHFRDDVYMAGRLLQWVVGKLREQSVDVTEGELIMHITSLHIFRGDYPIVRGMLSQTRTWTTDDDEPEYGAAF